MKRLPAAILVAATLAISVFIGHGVTTAKPVQACGYNLLSAGPVGTELIHYPTGPAILGGYSYFYGNAQVALYYDCSGDVFARVYGWDSGLGWPYPNHPGWRLCVELYVDGYWWTDGSGSIGGYSAYMDTWVVNAGPGTHSLYADDNCGNGTSAYADGSWTYGGTSTGVRG